MNSEYLKPQWLQLCHLVSVAKVRNLLASQYKFNRFILNITTESIQIPKENKLSVWCLIAEVAITFLESMT